MPKNNRITSWSFSRYNTYRQCPLKAKLKFIDKIPEPSSAALDHGNKCHDLAERYIKGSLTRLPKELRFFASLFRNLRKQYKKSINNMSCEDSWAFTKEWGETVYNDWDNCWLRIKIDVAVEEAARKKGAESSTLLIYDWKTGKFREENNDQYAEQLDLYALGVFLCEDYNHIDTVKAKLMYLDSGLEYPRTNTPLEDMLTFHRKDLPKLKKQWEQRTRGMLKDKSFKPLPNRFCQWCHYRKNNKENGGGQCKF